MIPPPNTSAGFAKTDTKLELHKNGEKQVFPIYKDSDVFANSEGLDQFLIYDEKLK